MKIVVYTCIINNYDILHQPYIINKDVDYICFTNTKIKNPGIWQIRQIPDELKQLTFIKQQRIIKICPHRYLKEYDISVWIDGNFQIVGDIIQFINQYDLTKYSLYTRIHPIRNCIYDEAAICISMNKDNKEKILQQISTYKDDGYPTHIGMVETGILLRKHNDKKCILLDNLWASELLKHSHRDQLSFNYICWKLHFLIGYLNKEFDLQNNNLIKVFNHNEK